MKISDNELKAILKRYKVKLSQIRDMKEAIEEASIRANQAMCAASSDLHYLEELSEENTVDVNE